MWMCKKQGAASHSSIEAETISLEAALRMEGIPVLSLWNQVIRVLCPEKSQAGGDSKQKKEVPNTTGLYKFLTEVDHVPPTLPPPSERTRSPCLQDNESVIKSENEGRSAALRHVYRTHRINLDWPYELFKRDKSISTSYINTKLQIADFLTKGQFTIEFWGKLCRLASIMIPTWKVLSGDHSSEEKKVNQTKTANKVVLRHQNLDDKSTLATSCVSISSKSWRYISRHRTPFSILISIVWIAIAGRNGRRYSLVLSPISLAFHFPK